MEAIIKRRKTNKISPLSPHEINVIGSQMTTALHYIHSRGLVHRDIKPGNICRYEKNLSTKTVEHVVLCDMGFMTRRNKRPGTKTRGLTGTPLYASVNGVSGYAQTYQDDVESLYYTIIHMATGKLPWSSCKTRETMDSKKIKSPPEHIARGFPTMFIQGLVHIRGLELYERPDYNFILNSFTSK